MPSRYYEENLYPLQDGVLNTIAKCGSRFYLTGGAALSRAYYHHRYSEDLDFFVNKDDEFDSQIKIICSGLRRDGFFWSDTVDFIRTPDLISFKAGWKKSDALLKLDFYNDVSFHAGDIQRTGLFYRTDSIRNMLLDKLSSVFYFVPKTMADIREIALHESLDWPEIIRETRQKRAKELIHSFSLLYTLQPGLEMAYISNILRRISRSEFESINWIQNPGWETFRADIDKIAREMIGPV